MHPATNNLLPLHPCLLPDLRFPRIPYFSYLRPKIIHGAPYRYPCQRNTSGFFGKMVHGDTSSLVVLGDQKRQPSLRNTSIAHEQITLILDGELEMVIGGEKYLFTAGTTPCHTFPYPPFGLRPYGLQGHRLLCTRKRRLPIKQYPYDYRLHQITINILPTTMINIRGPRPRSSHATPRPRSRRHPRPRRSRP